MSIWIYDMIREVKLNPAGKYDVRVQLKDQNDNLITRTEYIKFDSFPTETMIEAQAVLLCVQLNTPPLTE